MTIRRRSPSCSKPGWARTRNSSRVPFAPPHDRFKDRSFEGRNVRLFGVLFDHIVADPPELLGGHVVGRQPAKDDHLVVAGRVEVGRMQLVLSIEQVILEHEDAGEAVDWFDPAARIVV